MADKRFYYKVYRRSRTTVNQYVSDGDFEGFPDNNIFTAIGSVPNQPKMFRSRAAAYPDDTLGKGILFDGVSTWLGFPSVGQAGPNGSPQILYTTYTAALRVYKANWQDGRQESLFGSSNYYFATQGFRCDLNVTSAGFITVMSNIAGTRRQAQFSLSTITPGYHDIVFGSDAQFVTLWIDNVQVAQYNHGSVQTIVDNLISSCSAGADFAGFGGGTFNYQYFFSGVISDLTFYTAYLTTAQVDQLYRSKAPLTTNVGFHYDMEVTTPSPGYNILVAANDATRLGGVAGTWSAVDGGETAERSLMIVTSTTSALTSQGVGSSNITLTPNVQYTAGLQFKAPAGQTITLAFTNNGATTITSVALVADGTWQLLSKTFTMPSDATTIAMQVTIGNANASVKTWFMDKVCIFNGAVSYDYFDRNTPQAGSNVYGFDAVHNVNVGTFTTYAYIKTWNDVVSDPRYDLEINSAGSEMDILLARDPTNYGEGIDVDFDLEVRVYVFDPQAINGTPLFIGFISEYTPDLYAANVRVILLSYGAKLDDYESEAGALEVASVPINNGTKVTAIYGGPIAIPIRSPVDITLSQIFLQIAVVPYFLDLGDAYDIRLYKGSPANDSYNVSAGFGSYVTSNTAVATADNRIINPGAAPNREGFVFSTQPIIAANTDYYILILIDSDSQARVGGSTNAGDVPAVNGFVPFSQCYYVDATVNNVGYGMTKNDAFPSPYIELWEPTGATTISFNSVDPSDMLTTVMFDYSRQGGDIIFDSDSIEMTGTLVSYDFISVSVLDAVKKILELAPPGWYFYIDHATKKLYFRKKANAPAHYFVIGRDLSDVSFQKRTINMINTVYFSGGKIDGVNFVKKYRDEGAYQRFGPRRMPYSDNRVTLEATADTIANSLIEENKIPEIRTAIEVLDTYDIETIRPGDVAGFRNYGGNSDSVSLWDVGQWDVMSWDFDISNPNTYGMQIALMTYTPDMIKTTLSTVPPDVNKRIEDINRNLEAQQTIDNPNIPT